GLEHGLIELAKLRASQINGCAHCIDMHTKELRADGESEQRLYLLAAWRESPFYSERERAALAWTEALTLVTDGHMPDDVYETAHAQFSEEELVHLSVAVVAINGANRLNIAFRRVPGAYRAQVPAAECWPPAVPLAPAPARASPPRGCRRIARRNGPPAAPAPTSCRSRTTVTPISAGTTHSAG